MNKNENTTYSSIWNVAKVMLKGKFVAVRHIL